MYRDTHRMNTKCSLSSIRVLVSIQDGTSLDYEFLCTYARFESVNMHRMHMICKNIQDTESIVYEEHLATEINFCLYSISLIIR